MKIICIGRNYAEHAKELNNAIPTEPVFFMKPDTALLKDSDPFYYPDFTKDLHHEIEIVIKINKVGKHIDEQFAHRYYDEIGLGIDFTARDVQTQLKEKGLPWEKAKAFDHSAVIGAFLPKKEFSSMENINFELKSNGQSVQVGNTELMLWNIDALVSYVSQFFTLKKGDIIFTGTPKGVAKVTEGDVLEGFIEGKSVFKIQIK